MQDFLDSKIEEIKILANFDLTQEREYYNLSVYEFYEHVWIRSNQNG